MNRIRRTILRAFVALVLAVPTILAALHGHASAADASQIAIKDFAFSPKVLNVAPGTTVTWVNQDDEIHQVIGKTQAFRSPALDSKDSFSFTFKEPGTYEYFCTLHPQMTGTVVVK